MQMLKLRRIYNAVDRFFDRSAIQQNVADTRAFENEKQPKTARQALHAVLPIARGYDRRLYLKKIVSQNGFDPHGKSAQWEFFFDLEKCRARLACEWVLSWDEVTDSFGPARIKMSIHPYPPVDSPFRQQVDAGELLHTQLAALWRQERRRLPDLPLDFRDTGQIVPELIQKGVDLALTAFSLTTGLSPEEKPSWLVHVRNKTIFLPLR
jgi:hypothetical protein